MTTADEWLTNIGALPQPAGGGNGQGPVTVDQWLGVNRASPASVTPVRSSAPPVASKDAPSKLLSLGTGVSHGIGSAVFEAQKVLGHVLSFAGAKDTGSSFIKDAQERQDFEDRRLAPYRAANPMTTTAGDIGGQVLASFVPVGAVSKALPAYNAVSRLGKMGIGAVQGAAGSVLTPTSQAQSDGDYGWEKAKQVGLGGLVGGALPLVGGAVGGIYNQVKGVIDPVFRPDKYVGRGIVGLLSEQDAAKAADRVRNWQDLVPGSKPTTAQVAGVPALVQTEKAANNLPPFKTAMTERQTQNNAARWGALDDVAGTELDLQNKIAARNAQSSVDYTLARQGPFAIDPSIQPLFSTPTMQSALRTAQRIADDNKAGPIIQTVTERHPAVGAPTQTTLLTGTSAHHLKMALDDLINPNALQGIGKAELNAAKDVRSSFLNWLENKSPEYARARQTFKELSPEINGMQAAQAVREKLSDAGRGLAADGALPMMTAPSYSTALRLAKDGLHFDMEPAQETALGAIAKDLQRSTVSSAIKSPGSDTAYNLAADSWLAKQLFGGGFQGASQPAKIVGAGLSSLFGPYGIAAGTAMMAGGEKIGQRVGGRLQNSLTDLLMNPSAMLPYLESRAAGGYGPTVGAPGLPNGPLAQLLLEGARKSTAPGLMGIFMGDQ